jgi:hypothetical protein
MNNFNNDYASGVGCLTVFIMILFVVGFWFLGGLVVQLLFNTISPIFHGPQITYWQGFAISWVLNMILGAIMYRSK